MEVIGKGVLADIKELCLPFAPEGAETVVIASEEDSEVLEVLSRFLRLYPIYLKDEEFSVKSVDLDESVRAVIGVGGERERRVASALAFRYNLSYIFITTKACGFGGELFSKEEMRAEDLIVCDTTAVRDLPLFYGLSATATVYLMEREINYALLCEDRGEVGSVYRAVKKIITAEKKGNREGIVEGAFALKNLRGNGATSLSAFYRRLRAVRNEKSKPLSETAVILAPKLLAFYRLALSFPLINSTFVFNNNSLLDSAFSSLKINPVKASKFLGEYLKSEQIDERIFCLNSFRGELIKKAEIFQNSAEFIVTRFKRLYKDRGFSYNGYIEGETLREALKFSSAFKGASALTNLTMQIGYLR